MSLKALRKCNIRCLMWLNVRDSFLKDIGKLAELETDIRAIHIENRGDRELQSCLGWILKMKTSNLETLGILSEERIDPFHMVECMKRKKPELKIRGERV